MSKWHKHSLNSECRRKRKTMRPCPSQTHFWVMRRHLINDTKTTLAAGDGAVVCVCKCPDWTLYNLSIYMRHSCTSFDLIFVFFVVRCQDEFIEIVCLSLKFSVWCSSLSFRQWKLHLKCTWLPKFSLLCKQSICTPPITILTIVWPNNSANIHSQFITLIQTSHIELYELFFARYLRSSQVGFRSSFAVYSLRIFLLFFLLLFIRFAPTV